MSTPDLAQVIEQDHRALDALVRGDPEPKKKLFSRRDDVTLASPLGPPARGWSQLELVMSDCPGVPVPRIRYKPKLYRLTAASTSSGSPPA